MQQPNPAFEHRSQPMSRQLAGHLRARAADASDAWRLYASAGRGFETPTFNELGYRADGGAGLALDLAAGSTRPAG